MGTVIKFPDEGRTVRLGRAQGYETPATVIILPVIRIERYDEAPSYKPRTEPPSGTSRGRRRAKR